MSENAIDPIPSVQPVKSQNGKFKTHTGTALTHEKYSGLLLLAATTHDKKIKWDNKFGSNYGWIVYEFEKLSNENDDSFGIESSVDMIQSYASKQQSSSLIMPKERWYRMSQGKRLFWINSQNHPRPKF